MKKRYFTLGVLVFFIVGCATMETLFRTKITGLVADPSFTYQNAVNDKLAIGGVVSLTEGSS